MKKTKVPDHDDKTEEFTSEAGNSCDTYWVKTLFCDVVTSDNHLQCVQWSLTYSDPTYPEYSLIRAHVWDFFLYIQKSIH